MNKILPDVSCLSGLLAAIPPVAIVTAVRRHNHGPLSAAAIGPLPNAAIRAAVRRLYCGPLSAVTIAAAVHHRYHKPLFATAIADRCLPPLSRRPTSL